MATAAVVLPRLRTRSRSRARVHPRRLPIEGTLMFALALSFYIVVANYLVFHLHFMIDDAYARIDNSFNVLFTGDPHLAAIGFFWPPLPSFLELPIIAFKGLWPGLVTQGFAGSIEAAIFSAGTVVVLNSGLRWAGVVRGMRWILCLVWVLNPMTIIYAAQGMSEATFIFFFVASILVFLRWAESNRASLLPLMGILVGLDCLCRNEAFALAFVMGIAVIIMAIRRGGRWREVETVALMFGLPAIMVIMLWLGTAAIVLHDPLYLLHANGVIPTGGGGGGGGGTGAAASASQAAASAQRATAFGLVAHPTWRDSATYIIGRAVALFPGVLAMLALLGARIIVRKHRIPAVLLIVMGGSITAIDIYLARGGLGPYLRYQISVIPFAFLAAIYVLRSVHGRRWVISSWLALAIAVLLAASNMLTAQTLANPDIAPQEAPLLAALSAGKTVPQATGQRNKIDIGAQITPPILALDTDGGRILCDSSTCFPIILNAPDAKQFVVTSDRIFEAAAAQPGVYHVEYFLVPAPNGLGALDRLNVLYPGLYEDGAGFAQQVGSVDGDPMGPWRLYRITGPTGRG